MKVSKKAEIPGFFEVLWKIVARSGGGIDGKVGESGKVVE